MSITMYPNRRHRHSLIIHLILVMIGRLDLSCVADSRAVITGDKICSLNNHVIFFENLYILY